MSIIPRNVQKLEGEAVPPKRPGQTNITYQLNIKNLKGVCKQERLIRCFYGGKVGGNGGGAAFILIVKELDF
jgi:hypothetical protein